MRFLFIVQGEGRGHLTQAIALEKMLRRNGHEVVEMLVGKNSFRRLPRFFKESVQCPVRHFMSPNFTPPAKGGRASLAHSVLFNMRHLRSYARSMKFINSRIHESGADRVVNFYEVLCGLTYGFYRPSVPQLCVGHQYLFLHPDFQAPAGHRIGMALLRGFTRLTSIGARERFALSFRPMAADAHRRISVVPPLLREEVLRSHTAEGDYVLGYLLNPGFAESLEAWHGCHRDTLLHFFWDKRDEPAVKAVDDTLTYYGLNDAAFVREMAGCKAYACTAGFESVCEAMFLGKPVMMVPAHIEQTCNAYDALRSGAGIVAHGFDVTRLLAFCEKYRPQPQFATWVMSAESRLMSLIEQDIYHTDVAALDEQLLFEGAF